MSELTAVCQRKGLLGKSVITLDEASKAGTINEIWVDSKTRHVAAIGCLAKGRNLLVLLNQIQVLGEDAVLVSSIESLTEDLPETFVRLVDHEVVTEGGKRIGQIDDYYFERSTGEITNFLLSAGGISGFLEGHTRLEGSELIVIGKERSIVKSGAEERVVQIDKGLQQWVEVGRSKVKETAAKVQETASTIKDRIGTPKKDESSEHPVIEEITSEESKS